MSEKLNIDELLNSYVDGELSERQATEVKRLMLHDPKVADKVAQLQRQRQLLAALPVECAPADMAASVRAVLERRTLLTAASAGGHHVAGSLHLFTRKMTAVAAMLAMLGGLGYLVLTVVSPGGAGVATVAGTASQSGRVERPAVADKKPAVAATASIELLLKTDSPSGLNSVIAKAIDSCGLWDNATVARQTSQTTYTVSCGKENMARMIKELAGSWDKVGKKSLTLAAAGEEAVIVGGVTAQQVSAVLASPDTASRFASARQFAVANSRQGGDVEDTDAMPGNDGGDLKIPKPSLTSPDFDKAAKASVDSPTDNVSITITVTGLE
jgi:anti-sigma-K factor RskA